MLINARLHGTFHKRTSALNLLHAYGTTRNIIVDLTMVITAILYLAATLGNRNPRCDLLTHESLGWVAKRTYNVQVIK